MLCGSTSCQHWQYRPAAGRSWNKANQSTWCRSEHVQVWPAKCLGTSMCTRLSLSVSSLTMCDAPSTDHSVGDEATYKKQHRHSGIPHPRYAALLPSPPDA